MAVEKNNRHNFKGEVVLELLFNQEVGRGWLMGGGRTYCVWSKSDDPGGRGRCPSLHSYLTLDPGRITTVL